MTKVITFCIIVFRKIGGDYVLSTKKVPDYQPVTKFLRGQSSKIFEEIAKKNNVVIVLKNNKPQNVIISYEKYEELKSKGVDI